MNNSPHHFSAHLHDCIFGLFATHPADFVCAPSFHFATCFVASLFFPCGPIHVLAVSFTQDEPVPRTCASKEREKFTPFLQHGGSPAFAGDAIPGDAHDKTFSCGDGWTPAPTPPQVRVSGGQSEAKIPPPPPKPHSSGHDVSSIVFSTDDGVPGLGRKAPSVCVCGPDARVRNLLDSIASTAPLTSKWKNSTEVWGIACGQIGATTSHQTIIFCGRSTCNGTENEAVRFSDCLWSASSHGFWEERPRRLASMSVGSRFRVVADRWISVPGFSRFRSLDVTSIGNTWQRFSY